MVDTLVAALTGATLAWLMLSVGLWDDSLRDAVEELGFSSPLEVALVL